jgi:hypothetical protein
LRKGGKEDKEEREGKKVGRRGGKNERRKGTEKQEEKPKNRPLPLNFGRKKRKRPPASAGKRP